MPAARRILIQGHVKGVFFREWTVGVARELGVTGWVRNRSDGSVEVLAMGEAPVLDQFVERLREGSPASRVDTVQVAIAEPEEHHGFARRSTV